MTAEDIAVESVRGALGADPRIGLQHHRVGLRLVDGVLTMEGEVSDVAAKKLALERAAAVPGVHHIVDRLRVEPARRMADTEIRDHLCDALVAEPAFLGYGLRASAARRPAADLCSGAPALDVLVEDGVVTLAGEVRSLAHKRLAGVLAWWVPGTRDVVNGIEVVPPEEDCEDEISDAVRIALEKDPFVDAGSIGVRARGAVVSLDGAVASPEQREMAEQDAWYVFGVDRVANRLLVRPEVPGPGAAA